MVSQREMEYKDLLAPLELRGNRVDHTVGVPSTPGGGRARVHKWKAQILSTLESLEAHFIIKQEVEPITFACQGPRVQQHPQIQ